MKFSTSAFAATVLAVIVSGAVAFVEGTLTNRRATMGFLNHGAMWGDLIIMSTLAGIAVPYLNKNRVALLCCMGIAIGATIVAHAIWGRWFRNDRITGH